MNVAIQFLALFGLLNMPMAQSAPTEQTADRADEERDRGDDAERRERRARWERYRNASPQERRQLRVDRMVDMTARMYELDDAQRVMVRNEIVAMQAERRLAMGADADTYDQLREQMFEFWQRRRAEDGDSDGDRRSRRRRWRELRDDPEFQTLRAKLRRIEEKYPMDWEAAAQRVEALLPPDQAARGRERREERFSRWRRRREERDRRSEARDRTEADLSRGGAASDSQPSADGSSPAAIAQAGAADRRQTPVASNAASMQVPPVHPWEAYVREFIAKHDLDGAQTNSAYAILKDARTRAAQIEAATATKRAEAEKIRDAAEREKRLAELNRPIDSLFDELRQRLDGLLRAAQRS